MFSIKGEEITERGGQFRKAGKVQKGEEILESRGKFRKKWNVQKD